MNNIAIYQQIINALPGCVFWKDEALTFLSCNTNFANMAGYKKSQYLEGKCDYDFPWCEYADDYRQDDKLVLKNQITRTIEPFVNAHAEKMLILTVKKPLKDDNHRIIGVFGHGTIINNSKYLSKNLQHLFEDKQFSASKFLIKQCFADLSVRESECLYYLIRGYRFRDIAELLQISLRTVESYIENIKNKMSCHSSNELIAKAVSLGFHYILPESILN